MTEDTAWRADGEFFVCLASVRENNWKNVCWKTVLFSLFSTHAYHKGEGKVFIFLVIFFYVATFFPWYPHLIIRYSNM